MVLIKDVLTGSPADIAGVKRGDYLVRINGKDINDVLDYRYYITEPRVRLLIHRCLLYTSPSPRDAHESRMPSSA